MYSSDSDTMKPALAACSTGTLSSLDMTDYMSDDATSAIPGVLQFWFREPPKERVLDLDFLPESVTRLPRSLALVLARMLRLHELQPLHAGIPPALTPAEFCAAALDVLNVRLELEDDLAEKIPAQGPLVVVSNHPFGGLDGVALMAALHRYRPDLKLLVNVFLGIFPDLRAGCYPLDVLSPNAARRNAASLRLAGAHLRRGGALHFFPSGTVSHWQRGRGIVDPDWQVTAARLAMRNNATVLPVFFEGRNGLFFNFLGLIHPLLRTMFLPREMMNRSGSTITMRVGRPIEPGTFKLLGSTEAATSYMRMRCYALAGRGAQQVTVPDRPMEPVAEPHAPHRVVQAFADLPEECLLHREGEYAIYSVRAKQSPLLMEEIGYLREFTFRLVGEGSGKARDLDTYDDLYHHLLLWNEKDNCLVGAYRLGKVREILEEKGENGLYTASLFRMNKEFFQHYGNGLELGRAVVHPHYQRGYQPLMLLWKGIGQFVLRHKEIHCLFGPVSLGLDYTPASLRTVVEYLQEQCGSDALSSMVRGRRLPDKLLRSSADIPLPDTMGYNGLVALVRDIEGGRGIPILFKHYLKLGGKIGAFHLDTTFNTLDAFLLMDLVDSPKGMLERYMSKAGAAEFFSRWKKDGKTTVPATAP